MDFLFNANPNHDTEAAFAFVWDGMWITDPYVTECGRFIVDPMAYYGLTAGDLEYLAMLNCMYREWQLGVLSLYGYYIEDMGETHGNGWHGQYRWMHSDGSFQDHEPSFSREDAIACCWAHAMNKY